VHAIHYSIEIPQVVELLICLINMVIAIRKKMKQNEHHDRHWDIRVIKNSYSKLLVTGRLFFSQNGFVPNFITEAANLQN